MVGFPPLDEPIDESNPYIETDEQLEQAWIQFRNGNPEAMAQSQRWSDAVWRVLVEIGQGVVESEVWDWIRGQYDNEPEVWDHNATYDNNIERDFGSFFYNLNQGNLAEYGYRDFHMTELGTDSSGHTTWTSRDPNFLGEHNSSTFIARDTDGNGRIDVMWRDEGSQMWIATESRSDGTPDWRPAREDEKPEKYKKSVGTPTE